MTALMDSMDSSVNVRPQNKMYKKNKKKTHHRSNFKFILLASEWSRSTV